VQHERDSVYKLQFELFLSDRENYPWSAKTADFHRRPDQNDKSLTPLRAKIRYVGYKEKSVAFPLFPADTVLRRGFPSSRFL